MKPLEAQERFWAQVDRRGDNDCWEWTGRPRLHGYGGFWFDGRSVLAHRFSYLLAHGNLPEGKSVCHSCDNPPCVNPAHLWLGTRDDNKKDSVKKGRHAFGARCGRSRLTREQVGVIRQSGRDSKDLARSFGVTRSTINRVRRGFTWKLEVVA